MSGMKTLRLACHASCWIVRQASPFTKSMVRRPPYAAMPAVLLPSAFASTAISDR